MKRFFSTQNKIILTFLLLLNLPFLVTGVIAAQIAESVLLQEKESKLFSLAGVLVSHIGEGGFEAILLDHKAKNAPRDERLQVLHESLTDFTDLVGNATPGLGIGYYSLDLDAIVTYGPSPKFVHTIGNPIPQDHPGRVVMATGKPLVRIGNMVRGEIMNAMVPILHDGRAVGYVWANELISDVSTEVRRLYLNMAAGIAVCFLLSCGLAIFVMRQLARDVGAIVDGISNIRKDMSVRIPAKSGKMGEVVTNINSLAADVDKATQESRRAISVLQSVMSNVDAVIYVCDPETKQLVFINSYLSKMLGNSQPGISLCYQVLHGRTEPCDFCPQKQLIGEDGVISTEPYHWEFHNEYLKKDFMITDRMVTWHDGQLLHMEVATDVTERNALVLAEAANKAQRDFVSRMSHELRTPMNGVLGMAQLAMQADPPPAQVQYLKKIQASASLLLGIINDLLDFSRIEAGKLTIEKRVFNLHEMVENVQQLILPRTDEKKIDFLVNMDSTVPTYVVGDDLRLSQVLLNLLGNASKFTLVGSITLNMRAEPLENGESRLYCSVRDSGIGMTKEQQAMLFEPFTQADASTSRRFGGTGLGLSISKALVELMGGTIGLESEEGKGSVFSFHIDLGSASQEQQSEVSGPAKWEMVRYEGMKFLLVEDNEINQEIAVAILEEMGATIDVAANGQEGVQAFLIKNYDIILMDVRMPIMDGLEATSFIRRNPKHDAMTVPIIAMTANAMREDREACKEAGMNGHVSKPIDIPELKKALYRHLGKKN